MATVTTPPASGAGLDSALKALSDIKVSITGNLPGESAFVAALGYAGTVRATMDPGIAKRWDALFIQQAEDLQKLWRSIWVKAGLLQ